MTGTATDMAFDLHLDDGPGPDRHAWIAPDEQALLSADARRYPQLCRLMQDVHGRPEISPEQSQALVQEIIGRLLEEPLGADSPLATAGLRLLLLFDQARRQGATIHCCGD
ncbi:hypothetical protein [Stenotrophomonas maltophilia]|uniref:hypothetical protein n=1 Tax=Stenotrophomonas maltophilia TaxID=40324 RepID=UPI0034DB0FE4